MNAFPELFRRQNDWIELILIHIPPIQAVMNFFQFFLLKVNRGLLLAVDGGNFP